MPQSTQPAEVIAAATTALTAMRVTTLTRIRLRLAVKLQRISISVQTVGVAAIPRHSPLYTYGRSRLEERRFVHQELTRLIREM